MKRYSYRTHKKENRKERKRRWIHVKNLMRKYPDCAYNGDFYCNHVYDPARPWVWVDFLFFHTRLKRYFAVAMVTAEYEAYSIAENRAIEEAYKIIPPEEKTCSWEVVEVHPIHGKIYRGVFSEAKNKRHELITQLIEKYKAQDYFIKPRIEIKDYGSVAVGVHATVNTQYIDEHVIRDFIAHFRSLGEPIDAGWKWEGEETKVDPRRLDQRAKAAK